MTSSLQGENPDRMEADTPIIVPFHATECIQVDRQAIFT